MHNYFFAATICTFTLIYAVTRGNVDDQHHTMARPLPPCSGNPKSLASYVMDFFPLAVADAQDPWASADALNARSEGPQPSLHIILCAARDAWKSMIIRRGEHGSGCGSLHARPTGDVRACTYAEGGVLFRLAPRWLSDSVHRPNAPHCYVW